MNALFVAVVAIYVLEFCFSRTLSLLNIRHSAAPIPAVLSDIYNPERYAKQQNYLRTNAKMGWTITTFRFVLVLAMLLCGGFAWLDALIRSWTECELLISLLFFGILMVASDLLTLPFRIYTTFVVEARFGFNRTTPKTFICDKLKSLALKIVICGGLFAVIILIYEQIPDYFWLVAWAVVTAFSLFMNFFYSEIFVPLFNKQTPLEAGELRDAIEQFAQKADFKLKNIYVIDGSKRSTKANAYFTGWGSKKRIVLYDTLIKQLSTDEVVAVLAHEIGHNKHHHIVQSVALSMVMNLLLFVLLGWALHSDALAQALGCAQASFHINLLAFSMLYTPISTLLDLFSNALSRRNEYQADAFVKANAYAPQLVAALKKISAQALSNLTPHPWYVFVYYSHPTLYQRITALQA